MRVGLQLYWLPVVCLLGLVADWIDQKDHNNLLITQCEEEKIRKAKYELCRAK